MIEATSRIQAAVQAARDHATTLQALARLYPPAAQATEAVKGLWQALERLAAVDAALEQEPESEEVQILRAALAAASQEVLLSLEERAEAALAEAAPTAEALNRAG